MSKIPKELKLKGKMHEIEEEDEDLVILPDVDNSELIAQFKLSLVGRLFNRERRSLDSLIAMLPRASIWDVEGRVRGLDLGDHRFQFDFDSEEDLQKVLNKRPCHFSKWSVSLERWAPHIGIDFPNTITFWVEVKGIPTHYWLDDIFTALGSRLGTVGLIEASKAKFQVEINGDLPLKFAMRAKLPSGEIVPVTVKYINLHRYCRTCYHISHEDETCPLLSEQERQLKRREFNEQEGARDFTSGNREMKRENRGVPNVDGSSSHVPNHRPRNLSSRLDFREQRYHTANGDPKARDRHDRDRSNVWKRIDQRDDQRHAPRSLSLSQNRDLLHDAKSEADRKRNYEASHIDSKRRDSLRREKSNPAPSQIIASSNNSGKVPASSSQIESDSQRTITEQPKAIVRRAITSPDHQIQRPFRLVFQKKDSVLTSLEKLAEGGESSDAASSAKKCLRFDAVPSMELKEYSGVALAALAMNTNKKSWYDQTIEDEEAAGNMDWDQTQALEAAIANGENPEKVINDEEEDWYHKEDGEEGDDEENLLMDEDEEKILMDEEMLKNDDLLGDDESMTQAQEFSANPILLPSTIPTYCQLLPAPPLEGTVGRKTPAS